MQILVIKLELEQKPSWVMSSIMGLLMALRNFALKIQPEWQKYIYHKTKVHIDGIILKEKARIGINYLAQFEQNQL